MLLLISSFLCDCGQYSIEQSLLDLALRTTAAASDPCHEDLTCCVVSPRQFFYIERKNLGNRSYSFENFQERSSLLKRLSDLELHETVSDGKGSEELVNITGLETFSLSYKVLSNRICFKLLLLHYLIL